MVSQNKSKKFEKLVVGAIRKLQDLQGSTFKEISDFLSREYNVPGNEIKKQVRLALRRGVSYGIFQRNNGNTYICNKEFLNRNLRLRKIGEVVEQCPWMKSRVWHKRKRGSMNRRRIQKSRLYKSRSRKTKKRMKRKKRSKKMNMKNRPMNHLIKLKGKNVDWLELLELIKKNKNRKYNTKKHHHRRKIRSRSRKKRGRH